MIPPAFNAWNVSGTDYRDHLSVTPFPFLHLRMTAAKCGVGNRVREYLVALFTYRLAMRPLPKVIGYVDAQIFVPFCVR
jgi:hypothetical protein